MMAAPYAIKCREEERMTASLAIVWERYDGDGGICHGCRATQHELAEAISTIQHALGPFGVEPHLEVLSIAEAQYRANPEQSNRIWIAGKPVEQWLNGTPKYRASRSPCRMVEIDGVTYAAIPHRLIVEAAILAASDLFFQGSRLTVIGRSGYDPSGIHLGAALWPR
jgi:hypothetical protein